MPRNPDELDSAAVRLTEQLNSLAELMQAAISRFSAQSAADENKDAGAFSNSAGDESLAADIRDGVLQIASDGVRIANIDELQTPARFG